MASTVGFEGQNWPSTCGNVLVGALGFEPRTSSVSRKERHAIYQHKRSVTCGVVFVVARHVPVITLCFAGFPRDGILPRLTREATVSVRERAVVRSLPSGIRRSSTPTGPVGGTE